MHANRPAHSAGGLAARRGEWEHARVGGGAHAARAPGGRCDGAASDGRVRRPRRRAVWDDERVHGSVGVEGVECAKVRAHHVLVGVEVDDGPLADGGHQHRVAAVAREAQRQRWRWSRADRQRHVELDNGAL